MCRQVPVARPDCERMSALLRPEPAFSASEGVWAGALLHAGSSRQFMDLDCTQQGILFSDERKNIQQPVFALGVLDTLPCFGIRHMQVVGVKLLSAGQKRSLLSSPRPVPRRGRGAQRGCGHPSSPGEGRQPAPPTPARLPPRPPASSQPGLRLPPGPRGARAWAVLGEPAPAWGPLTASPVEYCISWL